MDAYIDRNVDELSPLRIQSLVRTLWHRRSPELFITRSNDRAALLKKRVSFMRRFCFHPAVRNTQMQQCMRENIAQACFICKEEVTLGDAVAFHCHGATSRECKIWFTLLRPLYAQWEWDSDDAVCLTFIIVFVTYRK